MRRNGFDFELHHGANTDGAQELMRSVAPEEFCQLAVSSRPLVRWEDSAQGLKGLKDTETGEFFVVDVTRLMSHTVTPA